tara:strand:+ start:449 stop:943 length:495 start_codon:yes stop_codon:yes gene_type:complete
MYLISPTLSYSIEQPKLKNLVFHIDPLKLDNFEFKNVNNKVINISEYKGNIVLLNFWATWCAPCRDEMPSLDRLSTNEDFKNLKVVPINIGKENIEKSVNFFKEINISNLEIFYDHSLIIPKKLLLRGIPTTIFINKKGKEFARIIGTFDFDDKQLIEWLKNYD